MADSEAKVPKPKKSVKKQKVFKRVRREARLVKKELKKVRKIESRLNGKGPKTDDIFKLSLVIGPVRGNSTSDELNRQYHIQLNPLLMKSSNGPLTTPLSVRAANFLLYSIRRMHFKLTSLVGTANITGSMVYISLDSDGTSVKPITVSDILATPHCKTHVGQSVKWSLNTRYLKGPNKDWWYVNTADKAVQSLGPSVDVYVYMKTKNLLSTNSASTTDFDGPLFLLEVEATYAFSNYSPQPQLASLPVHSGQTSVTLEKDQDGSLVVSLSGELAKSVDAFLLDEKLCAMRSNSISVSDVLWSAAGAAVSVLGPAAGPWGWLITGGFWLLKRVFGRSTDDTTSSFYLYPSVADAMNGHNCKVNTPLSKASVTTDLRLQAYNVQNINSTGAEGFLSTSTAKPFPLFDLQRKPMVFPLLSKTSPVFYASCVDLEFTPWLTTSAGILAQAAIEVHSANLSAYFGTIRCSNSGGLTSTIYKSVIPHTPDQNCLTFYRSDGVMIADSYSLFEYFENGGDPREYGFQLVQTGKSWIGDTEQPFPYRGSVYVMGLGYVYNESVVVDVGEATASGVFEASNASSPILIYSPADHELSLFMFFVLTKGKTWSPISAPLLLSNSYFELSQSTFYVQPFLLQFPKEVDMQTDESDTSSDSDESLVYCYDPDDFLDNVDPFLEVDSD